MVGSLDTWRMFKALRGGLEWSVVASPTMMGDPVNTASTAAWHLAQFPDHINPTDPYIGFTIRPQASYNSDLNIAETNQK